MSPYTPLSPSSPSVNSGDYEAETITTQSLEVVTSLSPDCHLIEDDKIVMTTQSLTQPDCHLVTTKSESRGECVSPVADDNDAVLIFETFGTPLIIEVEKPNNAESENYQIVESENVDEPQQNSELTKTAASFRFQVGDRVINPERPNLSLEIVSIDPDGEWCRCKDKFSIERYVLSGLIPDEF